MTHHGTNADMVAEDGEGADATADHVVMENAAADMQVTGDDAVENMEVTSSTVVNDVVAGTEDGKAQHEHTRHQHVDEVRAAPTRTGRTTCVYRDYKYTRAWASTKKTVYRCSKFPLGCPGKMEFTIVSMGYSCAGAHTCRVALVAATVTDVQDEMRAQANLLTI
ncbi:hypothetical protein PC129_g19943 [Phytophthora cactorum]|uniref:Uncharacterized protein n=1 Tax=Phytophthora cactorum TaxID=29920 RepID=A0A329SNN6_9STRA|nr:hypothetical protein Pcac1_g6369 [Phytophthora cactorum]KAG2803838.1 hypothetical protein PC112_g18993 [Phytophthora cactorum]KAG2804554.1 hypothetical protein PC111_g18208 [Phytophthora cactorum]KAG2832925.1 hypothetical protein PC113_g20667 [Phytophthora cactorum]KAG2878792.1 hypothetical protein PC114_g22904 [Phytophthora cactorum]